MIWALIVYLVIGVIFAEAGRQNAIKGRVPRRQAPDWAHYLAMVVAWLPGLLWITTKTALGRH